MGDALVLFLAAMAQEDIALVTAGYFIIERGMSPALAFAMVGGGSWMGNLMIYGTGRLAHRARWLERWHVDARVARVRDRLRRHWIATVLLCRLTPGMVWPTMLGCGWLAVSVARFALVSAVAAGGYAALMLTLVIALGAALPRGALIGIALGLALIALLLIAHRRWR